MTQTVIAHSPPRHAADDLLQKPRSLLTTMMIRIVSAQRLQREREQLAELSDSALKDLGLSRADVWNELHKPVWRR
ncbi:MAG: DUF1127 domain-containing protein [Alphaproteobacteria bacterium]|nr:DUF1127 domain-containing protein [Alphaproteobacteria bacterium]